MKSLRTELFNKEERLLQLNFQVRELKNIQVRWNVAVIVLKIFEKKKHQHNHLHNYSRYVHKKLSEREFFLEA
jgi:hypothetical protein